jgi:hypothetical protein
VQSRNCANKSHEMYQDAGPRVGEFDAIIFKTVPRAVRAATDVSSISIMLSLAHEFAEGPAFERRGESEGPFKGTDGTKSSNRNERSIARHRPLKS